MDTETLNGARRENQPDPVEWGELVSSMELVAIEADDVFCLVDRNELEKNPPKRFDIMSKFQAETLPPETESVAFTFSLDLAIPKATEETDPDAEPLVRVYVAYRATYSISGGMKPSQELLDSYRDRLARFQVFPFLRSHVTDLTTRAGLPPLLLPLMKIGEGVGQDQERD